MMRILRDSEQYENHVLNRILTCSFAGKSTGSDRVWVIEGGTLSPVMFVGLASSINQRNYRT